MIMSNTNAQVEATEGGPILRHTFSFKQVNRIVCWLCELLNYCKLVYPTNLF